MMETSEPFSADLLDRLAAGWTQTRHGLTHAFLHLWKSRLSADVQVVALDTDSLHFTSDLSPIRLRAMNDVPCLLLGGRGASSAQALRNFCRSIDMVHSVPFVVALSPEAYMQVRDASGLRCSLILPPDAIRDVLGSAHPTARLKQYLCAHIPLLELMPFNTTLPAQRNMFFGRHKELRQLVQMREVSFAIAGPGRNGKTSLVLSYDRIMARETIGLSRRFYIDFQKCPDNSADGVAAFVAKHIGVRRPERSAMELCDVLKLVAKERGGALDLLLDEVDEVCRGEAFQQLGAAARKGYCRLILCGKENLLKASQSPESTLGMRMELLRLEPLAHDASQALLLTPLRDLGFAVRDENALTETICSWTGRHPQLLQEVGMKLVQLADEQGSKEITSELFEVVKDDYQTGQMFVHSLVRMDDREAQLIGLRLIYDAPDLITIPAVQKVAASEGISMTYARAMEVCHILLLNHVLAWRGGGGTFSLANKALPYYVKEMSMGSLYEEARTAVHGG